MLDEIIFAGGYPPGASYLFTYLPLPLCGNLSVPGSGMILGGNFNCLLSLNPAFEETTCVTLAKGRRRLRRVFTPVTGR